MGRGVIVYVVMVTALLASGWAGVSHAQQVKEGAGAPLTLKGAKVATEEQAKTIALEAFFRRMGGKRGLQTAKAVSVHELDLDVKGFAQKGDKVWEVRIVGVRRLHAIIWVHAETAKTFFLVPGDR